MAKKRTDVSGIFVFAVEEAAKVAPPTYSINGKPAELGDDDWGLHEAAIRNVDKGVFSRRLNYITGSALHGEEAAGGDVPVRGATLAALREGLQAYGLTVYNDHTRFKHWVLEGSCATSGGFELFEREAQQALEKMQPVCVVEERLEHCFPLEDLEEAGLDDSVSMNQSLVQVVYHAITLTPEMAWQMEQAGRDRAGARATTPPAPKVRYQLNGKDMPLDGVSWELGRDHTKQINAGLKRLRCTAVTGSALHAVKGEGSDLLNANVKQALRDQTGDRGLYIGDDERSFEYLVYENLSTTLQAQEQGKQQIEEALRGLKPLAVVKEKLYYENLELTPGQPRQSLERRLYHVLQVPPEDTRVVRTATPSRRLSEKMRYSVDGIEFFPYTAEFDLDNTMIAQANLGVCRRTKGVLTGKMLHGQEKFEGGILNKQVLQALRNTAEQHGERIQPDNREYQYRSWEGVSVSLSGQKRVKQEVESQLREMELWGVVKEKFFHFEATLPNGQTANVEHRIYHVLLVPERV